MSHDGDHYPLDGLVSQDLAILADPLAYRQQLARDVEILAERADVPADLLRSTSGSERTLPAVPSWVENPEKWVTLSRADRRALERHHRKQTRR
jgi:hypothetical protein